ncbi:glycosyltransferase family 4 protein [Ginsengibacter hankyongi]|uniref:Glycosyltransferase family 4 protein n=1 Tax=Ginsengibacter hankyongi TaxID=2607284 RepID=A0A5J5IHM3_9BACT|nr:glycosyltransferase [Ginsengibacter hankyongi]KAA9038600.1 glycosyltransferase family 4 protein [Ginsengibacter hankyongi]
MRTSIQPSNDKTILHSNLHIVCLDVPYPADYGGVFDLFYKIKALYSLGIKIHLHCFEYGRGEQEELNKYCQTVNYYERKSFLKGFSFRLPFIVSSRANPLLLTNLLKDDYPVLLEGIHCTYFLYTRELTNRRILVRLHNVEFEYYKELSKATSNIFKKNYYRLESFLLKKYENKIANKCMFIAVSEKDKETYQQKFAAKNIEYLPIFLAFTEVTSEIGTGNFCLYHGNLSVPENEKAALWLMKNVFNTLDIPFVIAGKNPSRYLQAFTHNNDNFCIAANLSKKEMDDMIRKAHIHVLPSFNKTGIKIKLLNALFKGRYVITTQSAIEKNNVEPLCIIANSASDYKKIITELFQKPFTQNEIDKRKKILETAYNNHENALQLTRWIW